MKRSLGGTDFSEAYLQVGGNHATKWTFKHEPGERSVVEIHNSAAIRAGIIQTQDASFQVGKSEEWLITMVLKSDSPEAQAYLRIYPITATGEVEMPKEISFKPGSKQEQFKQVVTVKPNTDFLRLETGVLGPGHLSISRLEAYPYSEVDKKKRKKRVTRSQYFQPRPQQIKIQDQDLNQVQNQEVSYISHIQTIGEIIKPIQLAMPIPLKIPVTVQANVNADTRNLTPSRDRVQIYGSSPVPLATSTSGRAQVEIWGHGFQESIEEVTASQTRSSTITRDVSALARFSFAVYNFGPHTAFVQAELSPDGLHWALVSSQREVGAEKLEIVSPEGFLRYTRVSYWAEDSTSLRIWAQAQG